MGSESRNYPIATIDTGALATSIGGPIAEGIKDAVRGLQGSLLQIAIQASVAQLAIQAGSVEITGVGGPGGDKEKGPEKSKDGLAALWKNLPGQLKDFGKPLEGVTAGIKNFGAALKAGGPMGIAGAMVGLGGSIVEIPWKINAWSEKLLEAKRGLSDFSASMALVFAESDIRQLRRNVAMGELTADSTKKLADAHNDLSDALMPVTAEFANLENELKAFIVRLGEKGFKGIQAAGDAILYPFQEAWKTVFSYLPKFEEKLRDIAGHTAPKTSELMSDWLDRAAQEAREAIKRNDRRFQVPNMPRT